MQIDNVSWTNQDLIDKMGEFLKFYKNRPIKKNDGGMKAPHMFFVWFLIQYYKFDNIIESGVWRGQSTWLFVNGSPKSKIFSFDIRLKYREWKSPKVRYFGHDFMKADWSQIKGDTLAFFDDHMPALPRIKFCHEHGFKYIIFEDNYPPGVGKLQTMKKMIESGEHAEYLNTVVKNYYEFPPVLKDATYRNKKPWGTYKTKEPLLIHRNKTNRVFQIENSNYTWLCFVELV